MQTLAPIIDFHQNTTVYKSLLLLLLAISIVSSQQSLVDMFNVWMGKRGGTIETSLNQTEMCEERLDEATKSIFEPKNFQTELNLLMKTYYNWGELLAPIPVSISILGQLILMSNRNMDFPININPPSKGFKHIEYPKSFRTTLLQISQRGNSAFLKAHTNMDLIKMYNRDVPRDVNTVVGYLRSKNQKVISLRLNPTLNRIKEAADKSKERSEEVVSIFQSVLDLIQETVLAVTATKSGKKKVFNEMRTKINATRLAENFAKSEEEILKTKNTNINKMLENVEKRQQKLYVKLKNSDCDQDKSSQSETKKQMEETADHHSPELLFKCGSWRYKFQENRWNVDDCLESNTQNLVEILTAAHQYELKFSSWQKDITSSNSDPASYLDISEELKQISSACNTIKDCPTLNTISRTCGRLVREIENANIKALQKTDLCPGIDEMEEMALLIVDLRAVQIKDVYEEKTLVLENIKNVDDAYKYAQKHQKKMLDDIGVTAKKLVELNTKKMQENQWRMEEILKDLNGWNSASLTYKEAIDVLENGLVQLVQLKYNWDKLVEFFQRIGSLTNKAVEASYSFIYFTSPLSLTIEKDEVFYDDLIDHAEKVNSASLLLADIVSVYVTVSDRYILNRTFSLSGLLSLNIDVVGIKGIEKERKLLADRSMEAYRGIMQMMKEEEEQTLERLRAKRKQIVDGYKNLVKECHAFSSTTQRPEIVQPVDDYTTTQPTATLTILDDNVETNEDFSTDNNKETYDDYEEEMDESDW